MNSKLLWRSLCLLVLAVTCAAAQQTAVTIKPGRNPQQPIDEEYTRKIR